MAEKPDEEPAIEEIKGENCPFCGEKKLTLREMVRDVPYFGMLHIFSMDCEACHYHKADVEAEEDKGPVRYDLKIDSEDDMKIRIVKSSSAIIKIPYVGSIESGENANGYVTNVEGILNRLKVQVEKIRDETDDKSERKKAKNIIKKIQDCMWGRKELKMTLEDPHGNSAIISEKAEKKKL